ncbi:haloacid dehalogenase [Metallosphaera tengchongensis]|uniref:Haloacid dehalogenase n=1 Tax=Metallosphaera tengchongensis TaxID=1532350 RepID=A0A6N0NWY3_9CREN|nr:haloacid dehalogenase [Metallosphaera tengchongensis]QKQ99629.1 haloacid dehalogenase [Metallosphaera tengchongensis]
MFSDQLNDYVNSIEDRLKARFESREKLIQVSREAIRYSGETISLSHRGRKQEALEKYSKAKEKIQEINSIIQSFPELLFGDVGTAYQEISEAAVVLSFYFGVPLDLPLDLGIPDIYYVTGIADAIGEMRRATLETLRKGDSSKAKEILDEMENLYDIIWKLEYPKSLVPGLRQKIDAMRRVLEETRHDVFLSEIVGKLNNT